MDVEDQLSRSLRHRSGPRVTGVDDARPLDSLSRLVVSAARRAPDGPALIDLERTATWGEIERTTRRLAAELVGAGIGRGDRVAVARLRSAESFEAVHAILRAGAVVVPIDPLGAVDRNRSILADAGVRAVVGDVRTVSALDPWSTTSRPLGPVVVTGAIEDDRMTAWSDVVDDRAALPDVDELPVSRGEDPAYLIYTSGSTGQPKGILHSHASGLAYGRRAVEMHDLRSTDRLAGTSPLHFDMSTMELYAMPLVGGTVVVMGEAHVRFPASLVARSAEQRVTVWYAVPYLLRQISERGALDRHDLSELRSVIYAGEPFPPAALADLMQQLPGVTITNAYGPAETNVCTLQHLDGAPDGVDEIPIGRPTPDHLARVVTEDGVEADPGEIGELWIAGSTLMDGYWNRPDLTDASIVECADGRRWYRTGDLVDRDAGGLLRFRGRRDHQVKIRGVRLELEAVESALVDAPDVVHAVVGAAVGEGQPARLTAAVILRDGEELDVPALRRWCAERVPPEGVPEHIVAWTTFPETASGKIDRRTVRDELARHAEVS